ncbi:protein SRC2-like [Diospyros lotus]|uniref:protein SRC2-like n=1 Tax=Diospyros lotus TaxID=55363 RepID=UPI00224CB6A6|nr:protein SRC2-like [Diospyros lotus]
MGKQRILEVKVISARYLHKVNFLRKMDVYVVVSISGHPATKQKTPVDRGGGKNPSWNSSSAMRFPIDDVVLRQTMVFNLRCLRTLGDEDVGEVHVPVSELAASATSGKSQFVTYQVRKPSGKPKGELYFSYRWADTTAVAPPTEAKFQEPVKLYPDVGPIAAYHHQPPPPPYAAATIGQYPPAPDGYSADPMAGCGYGYGYPPPSQGGYLYPALPPGYMYPSPPLTYGCPYVQESMNSYNNFTYRY